MFDINFLLTALALGAFFLVKNRAKLPALGGLGAAMPSSAKMYGGGVAALVIAGLVWWFWGSIMGMGFFWKLVACAVPIFFGWRLSKGLKFSLATNMLWGGAIALVAVFLLSNYGKVAETTVNRGEANFAAGTLSAGSSCPGTDLVVKRAGSKLKVQPGCDEYILDLSSIPEGPMLDLDPNDPATEGMSSSEFYKFEYFYRGGVLKGRVTPVAAGFTANDLPEVTAFFYPRSGS